MADKTISKDLLKTAHEQIVSLQQEKESLQTDLDMMMQAQAHEAEQLVQMSEQLWKLEEALLNATEDKELALMLLQKFKDDVNRLKAFAKDALAQAKDKNTSRLGVAVQVYEMKSMVDLLGKK